MTTEVDANLLEQARETAALPIPLAPYWEGRTYDAALETSISELATETERGEMYERLFALLDRDDAELRCQAVCCLYNAYRLERWEEAEEMPAGRVSLQERFTRMLAAVEQRLPAQPDLMEEFCSHFNPNLCDPSEIEWIRGWLDRLADQKELYALSDDILLATRILFGAYGATWSEAGAALMAVLDHADLNVRACAAYQIGTFCRRLAPDDPHSYLDDRDLAADQHATEGMRPLADYWELIRRKEIERPGIAGAFWSIAPQWTVEGDEWLLTLLEQADPEPYLRYFPCNLGFDAHERFRRDPSAIRRLMQAGRMEIALAAATESNEPIPGMETLLMELGEREEPDFTRLAAWHLAYHYNRLHPRGQRLGFVQHHTMRPDCDLYLLFSQPEEKGNPYAVVLYPKPPAVHWSRKEAQTLQRRLFPYHVRGKVQPDNIPDPNHIWYRRGYVHFAPADPRSSKGDVTHITIGYRSDIFWNPCL